MTLTSTITRTVAGIVTLAVTTIGVGAAPHAEAYNAADAQPAIGCLSGLLELHGRALTGSYRGERVYSMFDVYRHTASGWQLEERTNWQSLDVGPYQMAANDITRIRTSGTYYAAVEHIASWDGAGWRFDSALTSLMNNYAMYGDQFGSGYYARCS